MGKIKIREFDIRKMQYGIHTEIIPGETPFTMDMVKTESDYLNVAVHIPHFPGSQTGIKLVLTPPIAKDLFNSMLSDEDMCFVVLSDDTYMLYPNNDIQLWDYIDFMLHDNTQRVRGIPGAHISEYIQTDNELVYRKR